MHKTKKDRKKSYLSVAIYRVFTTFVAKASKYKIDRRLTAHPICVFLKTILV